MCHLGLNVLLIVGVKPPSKSQSQALFTPGALHSPTQLFALRRRGLRNNVMTQGLTTGRFLRCQCKQLRWWMQRTRCVQTLRKTICSFPNHNPGIFPFSAFFHTKHSGMHGHGDLVLSFWIKKQNLALHGAKCTKKNNRFKMCPRRCDPNWNARCTLRLAWELGVVVFLVIYRAICQTETLKKNYSPLFMNSPGAEFVDQSSSLIRIPPQDSSGPFSHSGKAGSWIWRIQHWAKQ